MLPTPAAARLVDGVSQGLLWDRARRAVADGGERLLVLDGDDELRAGCRAIGDVGVLVAIDPPVRRRAHRTAPHIEGGAGGGG